MITLVFAAVTMDCQRLERTALILIDEPVDVLQPDSDALSHASLAVGRVALNAMAAVAERRHRNAQRQYDERKTVPAAYFKVRSSSLPVPENEGLNQIKEGRDLDTEVRHAAPGVSRDHRPVIVSIAHQTWVYAAPRWSSQALGYLRAGAVVKRAIENAGRRGCKQGWYAIEPKGYVCVGLTATTEPDHPVARMSVRRPDTYSLPYSYVATRYPTPPLYARLPNEEQQKQAEPKLSYHRRRHRKLSRESDFVPLPSPLPIPRAIRDGRLLPGLGGELRRGDQLILGHAGMRSGFALLTTFVHEGRPFGLTTELAILPLDRMRVIRESTFRGVRLSDEFKLPIAFVRSRSARRYAWYSPAGNFTEIGRLRHRSAIALNDIERRSRGYRYLQARDESWVRADKVVRVDRVRQLPKLVTSGEQWIDVSILHQSLVAYEGTTPVYATLVSTGADGLEDPETSHATIRGTFRIHTKHLSATMDGDERGDEFDLRDVPYVQYFKDGYALHAAYWHDDFGRPRSHGCVNLAPRDAAWLFGWTAPRLVDGWHAALSLKRGTLVNIHP